LELAGLKMASKEDAKAAFVTVVIDVLIDVAHKYGLPAEPLKTIAQGKQ
jgi:hypothetical protein